MDTQTRHDAGQQPGRPRHAPRLAGGRLASRALRSSPDQHSRSPRRHRPGRGTAWAWPPWFSAWPASWPPCPSSCSLLACWEAWSQRSSAALPSPAGGRRARRTPDRPPQGRTGHRRDRVRRLGAGHRHRVRGPLRHVRGAQHERLHHVRQLHRHGRQSQRRLQLHRPPRERHPAIGSSRHNRPLVSLASRADHPFGPPRAPTANRPGPGAHSGSARGYPELFARSAARRTQLLSRRSVRQAVYLCIAAPCRKRTHLAPLCVKRVIPGLDSVPRSSTSSSRLRLTSSAVRRRRKVPGAARRMGWLSWRKVVGGGSGK